jgi:hypothetical protein
LTGAPGAPIRANVRCVPPGGISGGRVRRTLRRSRVQEMRGSTMHWLLLGLAVAAFAVALNTTVSWLMALCLLLALLFCLGWILGLYSARAGARSRDETAMIDPVELRRLREQAEARKLAAQQQQSGEPPVT